jgi:hypothetical protein
MPKTPAEEDSTARWRAARVLPNGDTEASLLWKAEFAGFYITSGRKGKLNGNGRTAFVRRIPIMELSSGSQPGAEPQFCRLSRARPCHPERSGKGLDARCILRCTGGMSSFPCRVWWRYFRISLMTGDKRQPAKLSSLFQLTTGIPIANKSCPGGSRRCLGHSR